MLFPIDVVFLSKEKEVIHVEEYLRPFRVSKVSFKALSVLELPAHTIYRTGTKVGDRLEISSAEAARASKPEKARASAAAP
jgi:uncharacterized membrane protein (UPF0127 family)